jgi:hypothetical protein
MWRPSSRQHGYLNSFYNIRDIRKPSMAKLYVYLRAIKQAMNRSDWVSIRGDIAVLATRCGDPTYLPKCSFFRLIASTCCGTGGTVGNPITIHSNVPTPMNIPLPAGFTPNQSFQDTLGNVIPSDQPLPKETIIPRGTTFTQPFIVPSGMPLCQGENDDQSSNSSLIWLSPEI